MTSSKTGSICRLAKKTSRNFLCKLTIHFLILGLSTIKSHACHHSCYDAVKSCGWGLCLHIWSCMCLLRGWSPKPPQKFSIREPEYCNGGSSGPVKLKTNLENVSIPSHQNALQQSQLNSHVKGAMQVKPNFGSLKRLLRRIVLTPSLN